MTQPWSSAARGAGPGAWQLETWRREILRYIHRLTGDADSAEDVVQEALLRFMGADVRALQNPRAWLYRVATNLLRDGARKSALERQRVQQIEQRPPAQPDHELEQHQEIAHVRRVLDSLPPRDRELLVLRQSGFRYREIAEVAGVKTESVPVLMARALARFRAAYHEQKEPDNASS